MNYDTLIIGPTTDMLAKVGAFTPTFITGLAILIIGWVVAKLITKLVVTFLRAVEFDKITAKIGLAKVLKAAEMDDKPSTLAGCVIYWVMMVTVLLMSLKAFGFTIADDVLHTITGYIPSVVTGIVVLTIGMLLAKVMSVLVYIVAKNADLPVPHTLSRLTKLAIVAFVAIAFLKEIGFLALFAGHETIFIAGIVFALSLSFGLAGKDIAGKYLGALK